MTTTGRGWLTNLGSYFSCEASLRVNANYAVIAVRTDAEALGRELSGSDPNLTVMSIGRSIEILKRLVRPLRSSIALAYARCAVRTSSATRAWPPKVR